MSLNFFLAFIVFYFAFLLRWYLPLCLILSFYCACLSRVIKLTATLTHHFKPTNLWLIIIYLWRLFTKCLLPGYENLWEAATEICAIQVSSCLDTTWLSSRAALILLHHVNFVTLRTKYLDATAPKFIAKSNGQALLAAAKSSRTQTVDTFEILTNNFCHA